MRRHTILRNLSAILLLGFGLLTLFLSTSIIFDLFGIREKEGNYVLFIVVANFICSFLYLLAAYGFLKMQSWTKLVLGVATLLLIIALVALKVYINNGGSYETKTVGAMIFRTSLTAILTFSAYLTIKTNKTHELTG